MARASAASDTVSPSSDLATDEAVPLAEQLDRSLQDVEVRGEVQLVGDHGPAAGPRPERRHHQLEQVDGRGIRRRRRRPAAPRSAAASLAPIRWLAVNQPSPHPRMRRPPHSRSMALAEPRGGPPRQPPERVAVEIDEPRVADDELAPEARERIGRVQPARLRQSRPPTGGGHRVPRRPAPAAARRPRRATPRPPRPAAPAGGGRPAAGRRARDRPAPARSPPLRSRHRWPGSPRASA